MRSSLEQQPRFFVGGSRQAGAGIGNGRTDPLGLAHQSAWPPGQRHGLVREVVGHAVQVGHAHERGRAEVGLLQRGDHDSVAIEGREIRPDRARATPAHRDAKRGDRPARLPDAQGAEAHRHEGLAVRPVVGRGVECQQAMESRVEITRIELERRTQFGLDRLLPQLDMDQIGCLQPDGGHAGELGTVVEAVRAGERVELRGLDLAPARTIAFVCNALCRRWVALTGDRHHAPARMREPILARKPRPARDLDQTGLR